MFPDLVVSGCFWLHWYTVTNPLRGTSRGCREGGHCLVPEGVTSFAVTGFGWWVPRRLEGILHLGFSILREGPLRARNGTHGKPPSLNQKRCVLNCSLLGSSPFQGTPTTGGSLRPTPRKHLPHPCDAHSVRTHVCHDNWPTPRWMGTRRVFKPGSFGPKSSLESPLQPPPLPSPQCSPLPSVPLSSPSSPPRSPFLLHPPSLAAPA